MKFGFSIFGKARPNKEGPNFDITPLLNEWQYTSGEITVRKITGLDGREKLQMRLDLGLLQMEVDGRPDGRRPHGRESLLEYFEDKIRLDPSFKLNQDECAALREESGLYYHRYLSEYVLEDFTSVVRDTSRNLKVLDLCRMHAANAEDRETLEQYRPYITMMRDRSRAAVLLRKGDIRGTLDILCYSLNFIANIAPRSSEQELSVLHRFIADVQKIS